MNLKHQLVIRITLAAFLCWLAVSVYVVIAARRHTAENVSAVADQVQAMVSLDVMQRLVSTGSDAGHPALGWVAGYFNDPLCLRYRAADGSTSEYGCTSPGTRGDYPHWLTSWLSALVPQQSAQVREISLWSRTAGTLEIEPDAQRLMSREWRSDSAMLGLTAVTAFILGSITIWVLGRTLRPTTTIVEALERIGRTDDLPVHQSPPLPRLRPREFGVIAEGINRLTIRLAHASAARAELTARLIRVQESERREIAHELHDDLGQCIAGLGAVCAGLRQSVAAGESLTEADMLPLEAAAEALLTSLRNLLQRMSAPPLDFGLRTALTDLAMAWRVKWRGTPELELCLPESADLPNDENALCIYRVVQEALSNIGRHAPGVANARVIVSREAQQLSALISNPQPVTAPDTPSASSRGTGLGLRLLAERVHGLHGTFAIDAGGPDFVVQATVPLAS